MAKLSTLSALQLEQVKTLRAAHVLREIESERIESSSGTIFVGCPDADQFRDIYEHHSACCNGEIRHHPLCLNGGALLLSKHSPIPHAKTDGEVLLRHVRSAATLKGIKSCVLYTHAPCGVAGQSGLDVLDVVRLLMEAKIRLKHQRHCTDLKFHCFVHVDHPAKGKRTYFVHRQTAVAFLKDHGRAVRL